MESKYHIDNFERFLREKTDEFRMYPSKRVWYGIYNNMHPGHRMPSVSTCIILIFTLLIVGYLHTDNSNGAGSLNDPALQRAQLTRSAEDHGSASNMLVSPAEKNVLTLPADLSMNLSSGHSSTADQADDKQVVSKPYKFSNETITGGSILPRNHYIPGVVTRSYMFTPYLHDQSITIGSKMETWQPYDAAQSSSESPDNLIATTNNRTSINNDIPVAGITTAIIPGKSSEINTSALALNKAEVTGEDKVKKESGISETDRVWMEDFVLHNKLLPKAWAGKLRVQLYVTPSVVYRTLNNNAAGKLPPTNNGNFNNADIDAIVTHKPSFGVETGLSLQYDILRRVRLKAGVQLNYSRYNVHGFENYHPIATSITLNSGTADLSYEALRATPYSNDYGLAPIKLHNESYQVSLPLGADIMLVAVDKLEWFVGATIQPGIVIKGRSYLISTDRKNYVQDPSMLNRFNVSAGFETYISYKTNNYTWQFGPQFRSQLFSTNKRTYSVEERLQNYGFKVGVSKKL